MIRVLPIFDLFRHGRAESAFTVAPVVFVNSSAELYRPERDRKPASVRSKWIVERGEGDRVSLKLSWRTVDEEGGR